MLAVMKKLTYDEEYNFENEVRILLFVYIKLMFQVFVVWGPFKTRSSI